MTGMMWLTWRLHRTETLIGLAVIAALGVALAITGLDIAHTYRDMGIAACFADAAGDDALRACDQRASAFLSEFELVRGLTDWLNFLPVIVAMLLVAPFLGELEHGAFRMSWTQSLPRARWALYRIGAILLVAALLGVAWRTAMTWWMAPFTDLRGRLDESSFNFQGIVPIAYVVFAAAMLLAAGSISRRTVPTLVIALLVFLPVRLGIEEKLRPRFREPLAVVHDLGIEGSLSTQFDHRHDWVVAGGLVDPLGNRVSEAELMRLCPPPGRQESDVQTTPFGCLDGQELSAYEEYHPASRFWEFQLIESAIYLGLAAALVALSYWWITRRLA